MYSINILRSWSIPIRLYSERDMYIEVIIGIDTKTRVWVSRVKYLHKP